MVWSKTFEPIVSSQSHDRAILAANAHNLYTWLMNSLDFGTVGEDFVQQAQSAHVFHV